MKSSPSAISPVRIFFKRYLLVILIVVLVAMLGIGYELGYRPGPGLTIVRTGTLLVTNLPEGASVYVDEQKHSTSKNGFMRMDLVPGSHMVIVDANGNFPWNEIVSVSSQKVTTVSPIVIPTLPEQAPVSDANKAVARAILNGDWFPTSESPLKLKCMDIYVENNRVLARVATSSTSVASTTASSSTPAAAACMPPAYLCAGGTCAPTVVFAPVEPVHAIIPLPGRTDALVVSFGGSLAAIEIDPRAPQYFAPLLHGNAAFKIAPSSATRIIVSAGGNPVFLTLSAATSTAQK